MTRVPHNQFIRKNLKQLILVWTCLLVCSYPFHLFAQEVTLQDWQYSPGQSVVESREKWTKLTAGEELARGKRVQFFPSPNYGLTSNENDPYDLTDGTLSTSGSDRIWFDKNAVGWMASARGKGALMVIDLGTEQPIGQIAIRLLGGKEQPVLALPDSIEFLASLDGEKYYSLQKMIKLGPGEKEQSDFRNSFYIPEDGKSFMAPFICTEAVRARYIALRIVSPFGLFTDQVSVLKATDSTSLKTLESFPAAQIYPDGFQVFFDGLAVVPRQVPFVVTTNITTPNWLLAQDNSGLNLSKKKAGFRIELPKGLRILSISEPPFKKVPSQNGSNIYLFNYSGENRIGPLWIEEEKNVSLPTNAKITITGILEGKDSHTVSYPIHLVKIPEVPKIKNLDISLAWLHDKTQQEWPHFLRDFHKMGFGYVSTFPRNYDAGKDDFGASGGKWSIHKQESIDFLRRARQQGYGIVYNESPFHVMWHKIEVDQKAGKIDDAEAQKLFTLIDGKRGSTMNILYRGKYFQDEIKRIANSAALIQPDQVYLDIELWAGHVRESKKDPRVISAWKKSGKTWEDFATDVGAEILDTLVKAIRQAVPDKKITVGLYSNDPKNAIYTNFFEWKKLYPNIIDIAQPSLYIQGRPQVVAERIRYDYDAMKQRQIIPWLSTGTYGEFDPVNTKAMVLESILNGARGVTYYWFGDFDPMDFYYHSEALAELAPYQELIKDGKPIPYKGDNPELHYTAFASNKEGMLLVGNYKNAVNGKVNLQLPLTPVKKVLLDGKPLVAKNNTVSLDLSPGKFCLIYFSK